MGVLGKAEQQGCSCTEGGERVVLTCVSAVGGLCVGGRPLGPGGGGSPARGQAAGSAQAGARHSLQPHVGDADHLRPSLAPGHHVRRQGQGT